MACEYRYLNKICNNSYIMTSISKLSTLSFKSKVLIDWMGRLDGKILILAQGYVIQYGPSTTKSIHHDQDPNIFLSSLTYNVFYHTTILMLIKK